MTAPTMRLTAPPSAVPAGPRWTDDEARDTVAAQLGMDVEEEILDGGSAARVYRARDRDGGRYALKVLAERPGVVDGHDVGSFLGKLTQLDWIRAGEPALGDRYPPVVHAVQGAGLAAYTTPYHESVDCAAVLRSPGGVCGFFRRYRRIVSDLVVYGYGQHIVPGGGDFLADTLVGRVPRRVPLLERHLPPAVLTADTLVVNGVPCVAPLPLLRRLTTTAPPWWRRLAPPRLMFPAHGDANTRNVLVAVDAGPTAFRLIDPRGSTAAWDPVYDLAKTLFSLTVWDPALRLGCRTGQVDARSDRWEVGFRSPVWPGYSTAAHAFLDQLGGLADLTGLMHADPFWRERLLLTHALHVLAEAACRLSDPKIRLDPDGAPNLPVQLALGHYLLGTLLLHDVAEQARHGEVDVGRHLDLVTGRHGGSG